MSDFSADEFAGLSAFFVTQKFFFKLYPIGCNSCSCDKFTFVMM